MCFIGSTRHSTASEAEEGEKEENVRGENENHRFKLTKNRVHAAGRRQLLHDLPHPAVLRGSVRVLGNLA